MDLYLLPAICKPRASFKVLCHIISLCHNRAGPGVDWVIQVNLQESGVAIHAAEINEEHIKVSVEEISYELEYGND